MEMRSGVITFPRARGVGPRTATAVVNFTRSVRQAVAGLGSMSFGFSPRDDHHLGRTELRVRTTVDDDVVIVEGTLGVRDWSGEWDDDYEGSLGFVVLAELEAGTVASNLSITGVELNQATQYFRSQLGALAKADNAIAMIAGKDTALRVYVDTQTDPSRPAITSVSGRIEVLPAGASTWTTIAPLNPGIAPRSDAAIHRANANDTLNFVVPGAMASQTVQYRLRVFDAGHPDQAGFTSGTRSGSIAFREVSPLRVRGVGVHYTRDGADIPAATIADLRSTMVYIEQTWPVGDVELTGMDSIDYDGDFTATGSGCGPGWGGLLDRLRDMQGDTGDVYYGLLTAGTPTGGVIGCGGGGGRVAAGFVGDGSTAAQEVGHAFGRKHAPCGNPGNVDADYPNYTPQPMGSIGEVGIDPNGQAKDPSVTSDFMSYCGTTWISPYTYEGLQLSFPPVGPSPRLSKGHQHHGAEFRDQLFLGLTVFRNGLVELKPSFHYPSSPVEQHGIETRYAVELRDGYNRPLQAERLLLSISEVETDDAALEFYVPIFFPQQATRIVVTCGGKGECTHKEIFSADIAPEPPKVAFRGWEHCEIVSGRKRIVWEASNAVEKTLYFLLRFSPDGGKSWRVIMPRTTKREFEVDFDRLPAGKQCLLQVLASEGIRTACAVTPAFTVPGRPREVIVSRPPGHEHVHEEAPSVITAEVFSPQFGSARAREIEWTSDLQGRLTGGQRLNTASLTPGRHTITVTAPDGCGGKASRSFGLEVLARPRAKHSSVTHGQHTHERNPGVAGGAMKED